MVKVVEGQKTSSGEASQSVRQKHNEWLWVMEWEGNKKSAPFPWERSSGIEGRNQSRLSGCLRKRGAISFLVRFETECVYKLPLSIKNGNKLEVWLEVKKKNIIMQGANEGMITKICFSSVNGDANCQKKNWGPSIQPPTHPSSHPSANPFIHPYILSLNAAPYVHEQTFWENVDIYTICAPHNHNHTHFLLSNTPFPISSPFLLR